MKKIGVVIVNYNDSINSIKLFESLNKFSVIEEIIIVDNNSNEIFQKELKSYNDKKLHIIYNKKNKGYASAMNTGAKYLISKYKNINIIFSNSDIIVPSEDVIIEMNNLINDEYKCGMVKVKEGDNISYGWKLTTPIKDLLCNIPLANKLYKSHFYNYKKNYFNNNVVDIDIVYGCFFIVSGSTLKQINYFDEKTFLYFEENILAKKLKKINKKTFVCTRYYIIHAHNKSIGTNISRYNKYKIYKKSQLYYEKKYNNANFIEMLFFKIFYYIRLSILKMTCFIKK